MAKDRIAITGMGIYTALCKGVSQNHQALHNNKSGISDITILQTKHQGSLPAGEIKKTNEELRNATRYHSDEKIPRSVLLSIPAIEESISMSGMPDLSECDFYYATTVGGIDISEQLLLEKSNGIYIHHNEFRYHDCGASTELLSDYFKIKGRQYTISTACSSSANAIGLAAQALNSGITKYAIAGGADALCRFTINGFNSLMILDKEPCRPMDNSRNGLNLGEGAAFLVLETEQNAIERGANILGFVVGFSNTNDSHHQTASSENGEGAYLAIQGALTDAQLAPEDISYINAHGTGTQNNDLSEGNALERVFDQMPPVSSTKSFTGHTLAASGAIEAVFSILSLRHQEIYPTLRWNKKIEGHQFASFNSKTDHEVKYILSNAFGFGGNCSSLIFGK